MLSKALCACLFIFFLLAACNNADTNTSSSPDSTSAAKDSLSADLMAYENCYQTFFKGLPTFKDSASAALRLQNGQQVSMTQFFRDEFMSQNSEYGEKDLDGDGTTELILYNNTGGAHCCDEFYIFQKTSDSSFNFKGHITGSACVDANTNVFSFSFSEMLGYFFGCYACAFDDSTGVFKRLRGISLKYSKSGLAVVPYDAQAEKQNIANLEILQKHGYEKMEDMMDNGWRKEYAMNMAVWYYNHGKNWDNTKQLFHKYYTFPDMQKIWDEFQSTLTEAEKDNTF